MELYKEIHIWRRINDTMATRYTCLQNLRDKRYAVQSLDFFHENAVGDQSRYFQEQFLELLLETPPSERRGWFTTLEGAQYRRMTPRMGT
jgi:hypothetical protein